VYGSCSSTGPVVLDGDVVVMARTPIQCSSASDTARF